MVTKSKKVQKTVYIDEDVWEALEKQMKMTRNTNVSVLVNDGLRYAMFPEYRSDRDGDLVKLFQQLTFSLADHRKKTARDLAFLQEMMLQGVKNQYLAFPPIAEKDKDVKEVDANMRLNHFMEGIVRNMGQLKPISEREEKGA
ncbi:MAG: hypothetical protein PHX61_06750 [Alphaproteobacteria bacterium]|nr:hypothetical protein [Alphaproteobacteria bacterium]